MSISLLLGGNLPISATDKDRLFRLVSAMCWVESLYRPTDEELESAWTA